MADKKLNDFATVTWDEALQMKIPLTTPDNNYNIPAESINEQIQAVKTSGESAYSEASQRIDTLESNSMPTLPSSDGKTYGINNRQWKDVSNSLPTSSYTSLVQANTAGDIQRSAFAIDSSGSTIFYSNLPATQTGGLTLSSNQASLTSKTDKSQSNTTADVALRTIDSRNSSVEITASGLNGTTGGTSAQTSWIQTQNSLEYGAYTGGTRQITFKINTNDGIYFNLNNSGRLQVNQTSILAAMYSSEVSTTASAKILAGYSPDFNAKGYVRSALNTASAVPCGEYISNCSGARFENWFNTYIINGVVPAGAFSGLTFPTSIGTPNNCTAYVAKDFLSCEMQFQKGGIIYTNYGTRSSISSQFTFETWKNIIPTDIAQN